MLESMASIDDLIDDDIIYGVATGVAGVAAGLLTRRAVRAGYQRTAKLPPPHERPSGEASWVSALLWAGATGAAVGMLRLAAQRGAEKGVAKVR